MKKALKLIATMAVFCITILVFIACDHNTRLNSQSKDENPTQTTPPDANGALGDEQNCCDHENCHCHTNPECAHAWQIWVAVEQDDSIIQFYRCAFDASHVRYEIIPNPTPVDPVDPVDPTPDEPTPDEPEQPPFAFTTENLCGTTWVDGNYTIIFNADGTYQLGDTTGTWYITEAILVIKEITNGLGTFTLTFNPATNALTGEFYTSDDCNFVLAVVQ